jgi:hypothetical protein
MSIILERCLSLDVGTFDFDWSLPGKLFTGNSRWFINDEETASIGFCVQTDPFRPLLTLLYSIDSENVEQVIVMESVPSNLNRGKYWFFRCPVSGVRCKKLHLIRGRFQHRTALGGVLYRQQLRGKTSFCRFMDAYDGIGEIMQAVDAPFFREYYAGKPTRRCLRMLRRLRKLKPCLSQGEVKKLLS